jgi:phospholipid/cholesterol/gamma-HCH transport system ATP-binding protein
VEGLTKSFGRQSIWTSVSLTLPAGEISVLLGPSGTGKSVFLKTLVGLLAPDHGSIWIEGSDLPRLSDRELYEVRKLFGVLFQDGALFGSMNIYDNVAFPLREHTKKSESEIRRVVTEKLDMVGLTGAEGKLPGQISGGMRKRAGLARALVLDPQIILFDEPDSGLDPVRTAYLNQLIIDLNQQTDATFLIVTHDVNTARTVPDNIGMLYPVICHVRPCGRCCSQHGAGGAPVPRAQRVGPIGMARRRTPASAMSSEPPAWAASAAVPLQLRPSNGLPRRAGRPGQWCVENGVVLPPGS